MDDLLILRAEDVVAALADDMAGIVDAVAEGYLTVHRGQAVVPPSPFLAFVQGKPERIIGLPAYLAGDNPIVGIKWIASFPGNVKRGIDRASAVIVVNDLTTGRPHIVMEGAIISATRTAASAALAARELHPGCSNIGIIGCGPIAWQTLRYLRLVDRAGGHLRLFDLDPARAIAFGERAVAAGLVGTTGLAESSESLIRDCPLVVLATSAIEPHLDPDLHPNQTILHLSLRDLSVRCIVNATNVVDSVEQVLQSKTSLHLAQQQVGHHRFISGSIAQVISSEIEARPAGKPVVFSPYGMGVLDLAVARRVVAQCLVAGRGVRVPNFFGSAWAD
jgi:ornithine cyclodeaminase